jgi:hypothetical protein
MSNLFLSLFLNIINLFFFPYKELIFLHYLMKPEDMGEEELSIAVENI